MPNFHWKKNGELFERNTTWPIIPLGWVSRWGIRKKKSVYIMFSFLASPWRKRILWLLLLLMMWPNEILGLAVTWEFNPNVSWTRAPDYTSKHHQPFRSVDRLNIVILCFTWAILPFIPVNGLAHCPLKGWGLFEIFDTVKYIWFSNSHLGRVGCLLDSWVLVSSRITRATSDFWC